MGNVTDLFRIIAVLFFCAAPSFCAPFGDADEEALHEAGWVKIVDGAGQDKYCRYALYASRVLAVRHPEVYLQADLLFAEAADNRYSIVLTEQEFKEKRGTVARFILDRLDLATYAVIASSEMYPVDAFLLPFLDRRMLSFAVTARKAYPDGIAGQNTARQIELASLFYLKERKKRRGCSELFIVYCDNGNAYVRAGETLVSMRALQPRDGLPEGNPVLIFNERHVWYPLMSRDDTGRSRFLRTLVERYKTGTQLPELTPFERETSAKLIGASGLKGKQLQFAVLAASKISANSWYHNRVYRRYPKAAKLWKSCFRGLSVRQLEALTPPSILVIGADDIIPLQIIRRANYLSPLTSHIAARALEKERFKETLSITYKQLGFRWNRLWTGGFQTDTVDESLFGRSGTCEVQAFNIASILDMAGVQNFVIWGIGPEANHVVTYMPEYGSLFSNGLLSSARDMHNDIPRGMFMVGDASGWAVVLKDAYIGDLSPQTAAGYLDVINASYNEGIRGLQPGSELRETSYNELHEYLLSLEGRWQPVTLP